MKITLHTYMYEMVALGFLGQDFLARTISDSIHEREIMDISVMILIHKSTNNLPFLSFFWWLVTLKSNKNETTIERFWNASSTLKMVNVRKWKCLRFSNSEFVQSSTFLKYTIDMVTRCISALIAIKNFLFRISFSH